MPVFLHVGIVHLLFNVLFILVSSFTVALMITAHLITFWLAAYGTRQGNKIWEKELPYSLFLLWYASQSLYIALPRK